MSKIGDTLRNRWVKFALVSIIYILLCVVWTGNLWMLLGEVVIYDIYISKYMYRLFWRKHQERKQKSLRYKVMFEWVESILFAVIVVTLIRYFIFAMYVIPTPSMEKSLLVGDYLLVSKLAYGPVVPNTPIAFPLVHNTLPLTKYSKSYLEWPSWKYHRLKGLGKVKRGDVVVFNFPAGDTVILQRQNETYYDVLRDHRRRYGQNEGYKRLHAEYDVTYRPVDRRENYVKRCVGLPGDTLSVVESVLYVNGQEFEPIPDMQYYYYIRTNGQKIADHRLDEMGISLADRNSRDAWNASTGTYKLPLTHENAERVGKLPNVLSVERLIIGFTDNVFPNDTAYHWTPDNFGPLWIPKKGATVAIDTHTIPLYRDIIGKYEGNLLEERTDGIYINGERADSYTFKMDYFFMMGDNRHNSADSRFWGFVPEDHIVGKASFIWYSIDSDRGFPRGIRWNRIFNVIK